MVDDVFVRSIFFGCNYPFGCRMRVCVVEIRSFDFQLINNWLGSCFRCFYGRATVQEQRIGLHDQGSCIKMRVFGREGRGRNEIS
jgi:hypothetical protein